MGYVGLVLDVVPLHAVHLEQVVEVVHIALVLGVVGIPNLSKERIGLCNVVVIPLLLGDEALGAPVTTQQDQCGAGLELGTAVAAFPLQLGGQITLLHRSAQALTAAELSSLLHIFNIQLGLGLAFVIAVIQLVVFCVAGVLVELDDLNVFPLGGDLGPILVGAVVSGQTGLVLGRYPV